MSGCITFKHYSTVNVDNAGTAEFYLLYANLLDIHKIHKNFGFRLCWYFYSSTVVASLLCHTDTVESVLYSLNLFEICIFCKCVIFAQYSHYKVLSVTCQWCIVHCLL